MLTLGQRGPLSRADLARLSGVTRTTSGTYVDRLIEEGLLEEIDEERPATGRGRPARPVWFRSEAARCIALVLDEGAIVVGVVNARGELLDRTSVPAPDPADSTSVTTAVVRAVQRLGLDGPDPLGIGLAVPGMVNDQGQVISRLARFPELDGTGLVHELQERTGLEVFVDNDSRAGALAELWWGLGRRHASFWVVQIGEGIGGGQVIDSEVVRGAAGAAGEVGHLAVDRSGTRCACGFDGCWETIAALPWLRQEAARRGLRDATDGDPATLVTLAAENTSAARLLDDYAANIALGLSNIERLDDPALIVIQGPVTSGGETLESRIARAVADRCLLASHQQAAIRFSRLGANARLLGAGALVLSGIWSLDTRGGEPN